MKLPALLLLLFALTLTVTAHADPPSWLDPAVVAEASRRAVVHAGLDDEPARSLARRARVAALLPNITVRVARGMGATSTQYTSATNDRLLTDDSLVFDLRVSLALDRLVFDGHEVALFRYQLQRARERQALEATVLDLLAQLEAIRLSPPPPPTDTDAAAARVVAERRLRARLELLTGRPLATLPAR